MQDRGRVDRGERWRALFDDLEGQAAELAAAELAAEVADRTRREVALLRLVDRLRASVDRPLRVGIVSGETVRARLGRVGADWLLAYEEPAAREVLIPIASLAWLAGMGQHSATPGSEGPVAAKLDFRMALRSLARDRSRVLVQLRGGGTPAGVIGRVGADFLELFEPDSSGWDPDVPRVRPDRSAGTITVSVANVVLVRRL